MLGIHIKKDSFAERWIKACKLKGIAYSEVDALSNDIIQRCDGLDALLWHWNHYSPEELNVARQIIASLEIRGCLVFPNIATCWHFDDKVAQKYLLEAVNADMVPTYIFHDKQKALDWISNTEFPKVFKLRCGAGSQNVHLVKTAEKAHRLTEQAFAGGFKTSMGYFADAVTKVRKTRDLGRALEKLRRAPRQIVKSTLLQMRLPRQRGYVYFQDFQPGNTHDTRVTIIGNRAFAFRRVVRPGDFRASGSGNIDYDIKAVDLRCILIAFDVARKLNSQSMAFDFVFSLNGDPLIVEISYCYLSSVVQACPGYWDNDMNWHERHVWPEDAIIEDVLAAIDVRESNTAGER